MAAEQFANNAQTTLNGAITSPTATSIAVSSASGFPSSAQFRILVDSELMLVTSGAGTTTWAVTRGIEGTTAGTHANGATVTQVLTAGALANLDGSQIATGTVNGARGASFVGEITACALRTAPALWLLCQGQAVSRTTYSALFTAIVPLVGTCTITIASPAVVTLNGHGFITGDSLYLTTTGSLPTGLTANTLYSVIKIDANTFSLATSYANAQAGTKINTSGSQSGTHSCHACPYGLGDGSTTFNVPNYQGSIPLGQGASAQSGATTHNLGQVGGEETHSLTSGESGLPAHAHSISDPQHNHGAAGASFFITTNGGVGLQPGGAGFVQGNSAPSTTANASTNISINNNTSANAASAHNTLSPYQCANYVIYAGV